MELLEDFELSRRRDALQSNLDQAISSEDIILLLGVVRDGKEMLERSQTKLRSSQQDIDPAIQQCVATAKESINSIMNSTLQRAINQ